MGLTYDADDMADRLQMSKWAVYEHVRKGDFPFEPIRVGRLLRWPKAIVDQALGVSMQADTEPTDANIQEQSDGPDRESAASLYSELDLEEIRRIASQLGHPMVEAADGTWMFGNMPPEGSDEFRTVQKGVLEALGFRLPEDGNQP